MPHLSPPAPPRIDPTGSRQPPLAAYALLWAPNRIAHRLARLEAAGAIDRAPYLFQVWFGVLYMWSRVLTRPETIGLSEATPVRDTPRARRYAHRLWRAPAILRARAVNPLDQVGLGSSTPHILRHLLGAYHPGDNAVYDLQILSVEPGALEHLRDQLQQIVDGTHPHADWLQDLCVYEGYHADLLDRVERWLIDGPQDDDIDHPDTTLRAFMGWCASMPPTPGAAWRALRAGTLRLQPPERQA